MENPITHTITHGHWEWKIPQGSMDLDGGFCCWESHPEMGHFSGYATIFQR